MAVISFVGLPDKPPGNQPCNGCGKCCIANPCFLAQELLSCRVGPCVGLEREGDRTFCGLVKREPRYGSGLYIGFGCDAPDFIVATADSIVENALGKK